MSWKPYYLQVAEMSSQAEREEFMKGAVGIKDTNHPFIFGMVAGFLGGRSIMKALGK